MDNKDNNFKKTRYDALKELAKEAQELDLGYSNWTDDGVMDFVNWYLDFCNIEAHYQLESRVILEVYRQQKIAGNKIEEHAESLADAVHETDCYAKSVSVIEQYLRKNREAIIRDLEFLKQ